MKEYNTIIIGGGASGLFLAKNLAEQGIKTLVIEKMDTPAKKLLITGGGMCNLTRNDEVHELLNHYGKAKQFLGPSFSQFSAKDTIKWFEKRGVKLFTREDDKIFPQSKNAQTILNCLLDKDYDIETKYKITKVEKISNYFLIDNVFKSKNLVLATGGLSYPSTGSTGDGYHFAKLFKHSINELRPALASFKITSEDVSQIEGIALKNVTISFVNYYDKKQKIQKNTDDLIFTKIGISGPVVLDISKYATTDQKVYLNLNTQIKKDNSNKKISTLIKNQTSLPTRLIIYLLNSLEIKDNISKELSKKNINKINEKLKRWELTISLKNQLKNAMTTEGGVKLTEINNKTLESKLCPNLFFCGEILDFSGDCGGYNLQACWSSAYSIYQEIIKKS